MHPALIGSNSASSPDFIAQETLVFRRDARRYEPGSMNLAGLVGFRAALELLLEYGMTEIEQRVLALAKQVITRGTSAGCSPIGPSGDTGMSGIVSLTAANQDVAKWQARLEASNVFTSLRRCRDGRRCLRVSAHFYNREEEIAAVFDETRQ